MVRKLRTLTMCRLILQDARRACTTKVSKFYLKKSLDSMPMASFVISGSLKFVLHLNPSCLSRGFSYTVCFIYFPVVKKC
jgi:hypothetical protein